MELGNLLFGKVADDCNIPFERDYNEARRLCVKFFKGKDV